MRVKYFYGYNIVAAGFIIQAVGVGAMFTYGVFFKEFQAEFGWSRAAISGASSLAFLMMGLVGIIAGKMNDRIGPKVIIVVSGISMGLGYMLMSRLQTLWQLYLLYGVLVGIGFSTHDVITLSTVARWFERRRGMMSGFVKVGTGSGQFLVPLIATLLIAAYGWRNSYLIIGSAALVIFVAVAQVLSRDPQAIGLLPDGDSHDSHDNGSGSRQESVTLRAAARTGQFWILCVAEFYGTGSHGVLFGIVLASGTIGGAIGPLMAGVTFDTTGSYRIAFLLLTLLAVIGFVLILLLKPPREEGARS